MTTAPRKGIWIDPDFRLFAQIELTAATGGAAGDWRYERLSKSTGPAATPSQMRKTVDRIVDNRNVAFVDTLAPVACIASITVCGRRATNQGPIGHGLTVP